MLLIPVEIFCTILSAYTFLVEPSFDIELVLDGFLVLTRLVELAWRDEDRLINYWSSGCFAGFVLIFLAGTLPS